MRTIGLYLHIPFCIRKCNYCDFNSYASLELIPEYLEALKREISALKDCKYYITTVYIGGGTPTVLSEEQFFSLFNELHKSANIARDAEITVEANPGTLSRTKLQALRALGVNRLSIGLQAYQNSLLKLLGRIHTAEDFQQNFLAARDAGFNNINVDLIFGLPNQKLQDFEETLEHVLSFSPEHISCYSLAVEEGTKFYEWQRNGKLVLPSDDEERKMYHEAIEILKDAGYQHYEISNFAVQGMECRHNLVYWTYGEYLGLGAGAHSFLGGKRFYNHPAILEYAGAIKNSKTAVADVESLSEKEQHAEFCFMGLRLIKGLSKDAFKKRFNRELREVYGNTIDKLKQQGLLQEDPEYIMLTAQGLDFANEVFMEFLP